MLRAQESFIRRFFPGRSLPILLLLSTLCFGQNSTNDVHITPRTFPTPTSPTESLPTKEVPLPDSQLKPLHVDVDLVLVPVNVIDFMNRPVLSLTKKDFALYEGNKQQAIQYFSEEDGPLSIAILLDASKSMTDKVDVERAAIREFFKNARPDDEYFAITFSDRPRLVATATQSIDELEQNLTSVEPGGPTAMLDAVYLAISELRAARYKRRAIVILSDGGDNASRYTLRDLKSIAKESDVQIYAVGLFETFFFSTLEEKWGKKWLSEITDVTGGRTLTVDNKSKVAEAAATISRELRNQYVIGFRPDASRKAQWRRITIRLIASTEKVTRRAYYKEGYIVGH